MLSSIYLSDEINHFKLDFTVEDPVHGQVGTNAVEAKVCFLTLFILFFITNGNLLICDMTLLFGNLANFKSCILLFLKVLHII